MRKFIQRFGDPILVTVAIFTAFWFGLTDPLGLAGPRQILTPEGERGIRKALDIDDRPVPNPDHGAFINTRRPGDVQEDPEGATPPCGT